MTNIKMASRQGYSQGARPKQREDEGLDLQLSSANRRKKKRPSVSGLKTVEVIRGRFGFGFTLSGQSPCVLSSVIQGSPAERVGLKSGDSLMSVNGRNVATLPHNEVVKLISACQASVVVQISEGYASDSSSGDEGGGRARPKFPHRRGVRRDNQGNSQRDLWMLNNQVTSRGGREPPLDRHSDSESVRERRHQYSSGNFRREGSLEGPRAFRGESGHHVYRQAGIRPSPRSRSPTRQQALWGRSHSADSSMVGEGVAAGQNNTRVEKVAGERNAGEGGGGGANKVDLGGGEELSLGGENLSSFLSQNLSELRQSMKAHQARRHNIDVAAAEAKCLVGYLGTIEMPEGLGREGGLQEIRNCIRRLRVEKKVHTLVLLCIFPSRVILINHHGLKLAEFPAESIRFCGVCADDRRFFGLVTAQQREGESSVSSSCHVFMVEQVSGEEEMRQRASSYHFSPTPLGASGDFVEFPKDADPILRVIYQLRGVEGSSPPDLEQAPSTISSSAASNSDSGIGGRDTDAQPQQQDHPPRQPPNHGLATGAVQEEERRAGAAPSPTGAAKLTVRAMPDPSNPPSAESSFNCDRLAEMHSAESIRQSMQKYLQDKHEHLKKTSQQLVDRSGGERRDEAEGIQQLSSRLLDRLARPSGPNWDRTTASVSEASFVRSLEDLRSQVESQGRGEEQGAPDHHQEGPPSLPLHTGLPLARFLYSSDSNLSTLEAGVAALPRPLHLHNHPLSRWQQEQGAVLRPDNQYPETQVAPQEVVRRRPRSQLSGVSSSYRASVHVESSEYDSLGRLGNRVSQLAAGKTQSLRRGERGSRDGEVGGSQELGGSKASLSTLGTNTTTGRRRERRKSDSASIIPDTQEEAAGSPTKKDIGRVGGWAADFDKLLSDPAGLQTFAEFLKKEFSHENIFFWCAAERFKGIEVGSERLRLAQEILAAHLGPGATDPVNVDSVARTATQEQLASATVELPPDTDLFVAAQRQIYNLMKFDSFSRFLKSDLYKDSLLADMAGSPLPHDGSDLEAELLTTQLDLNTSGDSVKNKSAETRRKSILPWNIRNRSKSKDRVEVTSSASGFIKKLTGGKEDRTRSSLNLAEAREMKVQQPQQHHQQQVHGGKEEQANHSTESCDKEACTLTRFILPDRATTVVSTPQGETLRSLISRLLDKRGLKFTSFDAFLTGQDRPLDLSEDCSSLGCSEVRVEPRVLFRLELPSKKSIGVKAKQTKLVEEVLGPILSQYGWQLADLTVRLDSPERKLVDLKASVTSIDNQRLVVTGGGEEENNGDIISRPGSRSSLPGTQRRPSTSSADSRKLSEDLMPPPRAIPPPAPRRTEVKRGRGGKEQEASLYEGLKQMTKGRLDDQRGLEINGELPDFLKNPGNRSRVSEPIRQGLGDRDLAGRLSGPAVVGRPESWDRDHARNYIEYIDSTFTSDGGMVPSLADADRLFNTVNPDESLNFSESRLSLGLGRLSMGYNSNNTSGSSVVDGIRQISGSSMEGMRVVQRPSIEGMVQRPSIGEQHQGHGQHQRPSVGDYESLTALAPRPLPRSGRATPTASNNRDYESLGRGGEPWRSTGDYEHLVYSRGLPQPPGKPRLSSVEEDYSGPVQQAQAPAFKRAPPPLPPKPARVPPPLPPHAQHLHSNFGKLGPGPPAPTEPSSATPSDLPVGVTRTSSGLYLGLPGEKGYNVSFV